jgi:hypothetical protein
MIKSVMFAHSQKDEELRALEAARGAGFPLPVGQPIPREKPDFEMYSDCGPLGLEVTEVLPPPQNASFISALAATAMESKVVREAEAMYRRIPGAPPVKVTAYFWDVERKRGEVRRMAHDLVHFVIASRPMSGRVATFERAEGIPDGFGVVSIIMEDGNWHSGGRNSLTLAGLRSAFEERIADKNQRVPVYRKNLPGAPIWLLLYSRAGLPGGIETFDGIERSVVGFDFDRVFFYSALARRVVEIYKL